MCERIYAPQEYKYDNGDCGIYQIKNIENGKLYIGSTKNIRKRHIQHFSDLRTNRHHCIYLQRAFNIHGEDKFKFEIIEYCDPSERLILEQYWIDFFLAQGIIYNVNKEATGPSPRYGKDNFRAHAVVCLETKEMFGSISEVCQTYSFIKTTSITKVCTQKKGSAGGYHFLYLEDYEHTSEEELNKIQQVIPPIPVVCLETKEVFANVTEAQNTLNIRKGNICLCCQRKRWSAGGLHFLYERDYINSSEEEINNILHYKYIPTSDKVYCFEYDKTYQSLAQAMLETGAERHQIADVCKGKRKQTSNGLHFQYA